MQVASDFDIYQCRRCLQLTSSDPNPEMYPIVGHSPNERPHQLSKCHVDLLLAKMGFGA